MAKIGKICLFFIIICIFCSVFNAGLPIVLNKYQTWTAKYEKMSGNSEKVKAAADTIVVISHKKFIEAVYTMAKNRKVSENFYYEGDYNDIFDGDINTLLSEICLIDDKNTSDDADYLENSISKINISTSYNYIGSKIIDSTIGIKIEYLETAAQLKEVNKRVKEVLKELNIKEKATYKKVKLIHDYIVNHTRYVSTSNSHTGYGALIKGKAVCQGYSQLAYKMLTEAGVKCYFISGKADNGKKVEDHAWNMVKIGKKWYYMDVTWDDPTGGEDRLSYTYFLIGSKNFHKDHQAFPEFKKKIAKVSKKDYKRQ